jgi:hypothetical protein
MNYACDVDVWRAWAEAVLTGRIAQRIERSYNAGIVFKRAQGQGRIRRVEGLERLLGDFGRSVVSVELLPIGAPRRNWKQTLVSDGWIVVRHPDLQETVRMCDRIASELQLYAG